MRGIAWLVVAAVAAALVAPSALPRLIERLAAPAAAPTALVEKDQLASGVNRIAVAPGPGGHFYLEARVHGEPIRFVVDTGASAVVLDPEDARRIGLAPERLRFSERFRTANGLVRVAPVTLRELRIGQLALPHLPAVVNEAPIGVSLLGTSFLARLQGWRVEGGRLLLEW
ncbi:MAG: TIGR02281 family clan AA aspartic protease [Geminicoccaceae bacterium]|nr:TIGR02281 family clan AA aspartic protease [Geminicoccaceae bacterium]